MTEIRNKLKTFAIVGAGGLGSFYGAKLLSKADRVQFQSEFLSKNLPKEELFEIKSIWGNFSTKLDVQASTKTMFPADVIIVATKALKHIDYPTLLSPFFEKSAHSDTIIVCLQNGIAQEEAFEEMFSSAHVIGGLAFTCVYRESYNRVCHVDHGLVTLAPLRQEALCVTERLSQLFNDCGIQCKVETNLKEIRWKKLIWNIPFNPLSVILDKATTLDILENPETCCLVKSLMQETARIAYSDGKIIITDEYIHSMIQKTTEMEPYKTSMFQDYEQGREIEIDAILEKPLQIAQKNHICVPQIRMLYQLLYYKKMKRKT